MSCHVLGDGFLRQCVDYSKSGVRNFQYCVKSTQCCAGICQCRLRGNLQCASRHFRKYIVNIRQIFALVSMVLLTSGCSTVEGTATHRDYKKLGSNASHNALYQLMNEADNAYNSEDWVQASNSYREVIETIPNDAYAWFRMGNALTQLGQYAQAVVAYETSLAADNGQFKAWFNLSTTHLLNAKVVTLNALRSIGMNDPSRKQVERRLDILTALLN
ncbi:MAG: tetratricopeptide (TPR) repeat protein [Granulosicoccus sp.]|jgi:tetratricopeptide (TPR) repeat protein